MASEKLTMDRAIRILHPLTTREELQGLCREDAIDMCESACLMVCIAAQFRIPVRPKKSDDGLLCHCPTCGRCVMATNYCGSCGQAFDLGGGTTNER